LKDALAAVEYVRKLPFVDRRSLVVAGCSGGGDLAIQIAARTSVTAVVAEEPASVLMSGVFNTSMPKRGERYVPDDSFSWLATGRRYYTAEMQRALRATLAKIRVPILVVQGDVDRPEIAINRFNADVLLPELRDLHKHVEVKTYADQAHCFCAGSGAPRREGLALPPASWPAAALKAFQDIDAFCRRYIRTGPTAIDPALIAYDAVHTGPTSK
jgi:dienelactone hydrolase